MKVFADTSFLIAFYDVHDQYHKQAESILKSNITDENHLLITDYIYDETLTYFINKYGNKGYLITKILDADTNKHHKLSLIFINEIIWDKAREMFFRFNKDKKFSFTDCTSFAMMKDLGLRDVLSFDYHFKEMGFKMIIPIKPATLKDAVRLLRL